MPKYLVERSIPCASELTAMELKAISQQIMLVQQEMEVHIQWIYSAFTADSMVCLYAAEDEKAVREHARRSGLPILRISKASAIIGPRLDTVGAAPDRIDSLTIALIVQAAER